MTDIFQGDIALFLDENGSYMKYRGGQPAMDGGWENAILISLFTRQNWPGNIFFDENDQKVGSDFEDICNCAITIANLNKIKNAAYRALKWMLDKKIASAIEINVRNPSGNRIEILILIKPPSEEIALVSLTRIGSNWLVQKTDPAHERS